MTANPPPDTPAPLTTDKTILPGTDHDHPLNDQIESTQYLLALQGAVLAYLIASLAIGLANQGCPHGSPLLRLLLTALPLSIAAPAAFLAVLSPKIRQNGLRKTIQWHPDSLPTRKLSLLQRLALLIIASLTTAAITHKLMELAGWTPETQNIVSLLSHTSSADMLVAMTLLAVLLAPLSEEILFRLGLQEALASYLKPTPANLITALIFALAHGQLSTLPPLFVVGLFLQQARKTGGLRLSVILHAAYNASQILLILAMKHAADTMPT